MMYLGYLIRDYKLEGFRLFYLNLPQVDARGATGIVLIFITCYPKLYTEKENLYPKISKYIALGPATRQHI